jgi:hypothetical protein
MMFSFALLLSSLPVLVLGANVSLVREVDSLLVIQESINIRKIDLHLHLWARELSLSSEKLDRLMGSRVMRESSLLLAALSPDRSVPVLHRVAEQSSLDNGVSRGRRFKRNILGDFLHAVTGVATSEELQQQLKIDAEIRDKITSTLSRQLAFESTIAGVYANLSREEEGLAARLESVSEQHFTDREILSRQLALSRLALDDIEELEDVLEAIRLGTVNTRHAVRLSSKAGLKSVASFSVLSVSDSEVGPSVGFLSRIYREVPVQKMVEAGPYFTLETAASIYLMHRGHDLIAPISELEVRATYIPCPECALLVYMGGLMYKVVRAGELTCDGVAKSYLLGEVEVINSGVECENSAMKVGGRHLRTREMKVDLEDVSGVDALLLQKAMASGKLSAESSASVKQQHLLTNLKLQSELSGAQQDLTNFIEETKLDMSTDYVQDNVTWGLVGGLFLLFGVIFTCICCRYVSLRPGRTIVVPAVPTSVSSTSM